MLQGGGGEEAVAAKFLNIPKIKQTRLRALAAQGAIEESQNAIKIWEKLKNHNHSTFWEYL